MVRVGVAGAGYWGKNLVRNFHLLSEEGLHSCCEADPSIHGKLKKQYPSTRILSDYAEFLKSPGLEAVVVATPATLHYGMAKEALLAGKDVFVEKPMTLLPEEADELVELADKGGRILMVGHLLEYHPGVGKLKELVESGELGEIYYLYSQRVNLGKIRKNENALWSFAPHDLSIILYLLGKEPESVAARGASYIQSGVEDVVFVNLRFPGGAIANVHLSWLDPHKVRKTTVVGSRKMAVFDDVEATEKIRIYDKGVETAPSYASYGDSLTLRSGDIYIPKVDMREPLGIECAHFLDCVRTRNRPRTDGASGRRVVRVLHAAQTSLERNGEPVPVG